MEISLKSLPPTFLRYGLVLNGKRRKILVDLNSNKGLYELLLHRIDIEFDSVSSAKGGDAAVAASGELCLVALVEYECGKVETIYYSDLEPSERFYSALEPIASECYFRPNDLGGFLKKCLLPDAFLRLNISLRALCESVESVSSGKVYFVLNGNGKPLEASSFSDRGIEVTIAGDQIGVSVESFDFERLHWLLSCIFVVLEATEWAIEGIEFDLRKSLN